MKAIRRFILPSLVMRVDLKVETPPVITAGDLLPGELLLISSGTVWSNGQPSTSRWWTRNGALIPLSEGALTHTLTLDDDMTTIRAREKQGTVTSTSNAISIEYPHLFDNLGEEMLGDGGEHFTFDPNYSNA